MERVLSPLGRNEVGTIRCIGLNVSPASTQHWLTSVPHPCSRDGYGKSRCPQCIHEALEFSRRSISRSHHSSCRFRQGRCRGLRVGSRLGDWQDSKECLRGRRHGLSARVRPINYSAVMLMIQLHSCKRFVFTTCSIRSITMVLFQVIRWSLSSRARSTARIPSQGSQRPDHPRRAQWKYSARYGPSVSPHYNRASHANPLVT